MTEPRNALGTLGDALGELRAPAVPRPVLPSYELPSDRRAVTVADVVRPLTDGPRPAQAAHVAGVFASATALVAARLAKNGEPPLVVVADLDAAVTTARDIAFFLGRGAPRVLTYLPSDVSPYADVNPDRRAAQLRLATLAHLERALPFAALVVPVTALARKVVPRATVRAHMRTIREGEEIDREALVRDLSSAGYVRAPLVEDPGAFAVRGGLLDVWPTDEERPVRIELYGDLVLSIKTFEPEDQRTLEIRGEVTACLARDNPLTSETMARARERVQHVSDAVDLPSSKARSVALEVASGRAFFGADGFLPAFVDLEPLETYLPGHMPVLLEDPPALTSALRDDVGRAVADLARKEREPHFPLDAFFVSEREATAAIARRPHLALHRAATAGEAAAVDAFDRFESAPEDTPTLFTFDQSDLRRAVAAARQDKGKSSALEPLIERLRHFQEQGLTVVIAARAHTQVERIATLLQHKGLRVEIAEGALPEAMLDPRSDLRRAKKDVVTLVASELAHGLVAPGEGLALVTEEDIFGARSARRAQRAQGASKSSKAKAFVEDLKSLAVGDFVVHVEHGVGRYLGLSHRDVGGARIDLISVEYAGGDKLYLPVYRLNQIQKFSGGDAVPKLDRLGGATFAKTKARTEKQVRQMADELLRLYAERRGATRPPLSGATDDLRAFEATFPFEETPDQSAAIADVERDLELPAPMDRLVCGDVGFGKTEVAIRAAFRVANEGRQVAVLCPTTVLAEQHTMSFASRMRDYPLTVRSLSRFSTKTEQDEVLRGLKAGTVDVVVGTHRLLSKDVHFKKLGLLVVDEEQRFGVAHKERIKQMRTQVDVLTLSATPIPRTLQMAVTGLRDMSVITTPPVDRRAIRTIVTKYDEGVLSEAVRREIDRGGQIFYVYNRVDGLYEKAARLQELVPSARICVAHGQMSPVALEKAMIDFVDGRYDILCATAIIESGLDIPRANTMIIDRADMFGLAQLYQLRGRVGRSRERAYCYLVVPPQSSLTDEARARIEALERHTELGAGFHVASLDLELRGAGNLLGAEQSGTVASVGFELFCQMLEEAVSELRGEVVVHEVDPDLSIDEDALVPDDYVEDVGVRLSLYKRLACASSVDEVSDLASEMEDRFGAPPEAARRFIHLMRLKVELRKLRVLGCDASARSVTLHLREDTPLDPEKMAALALGKRSPWKLTPDMRITRRIDETEGISGGLAATEKVLAELARCVRPDA